MGDMGDMGELDKDWQQIRQEKKKNNAEHAIKLLEEYNIVYIVLSNNGPHLRIKDYDLWCSTGLFVNRKTKEWGRGIKKLIILLLK